MNKQEVIKKINLEMFAHPTWKPEDADAPTPDFKDGYNAASKANIKIINQLDEPTKVIAHLAEKWHEDIGPVLWWDFPVEEPPYCGTPLDDDFPKYKTHFTELHIPDEVEEEPRYKVIMPNPQSKNGNLLVLRRNQRGTIGLSGEVMRFDSEDKANAIVTLIECGTVEKV
ncbi:hypothetical protein TTRE_0000853401 [Trichuris trichiura]|uniref:Uncharacterized protein n=1 Tax=Trichuris trichiura TaxID=36087 RepID=A0A077ZK97_TRITR|nr:hypothetical protein TTRE_0000853401 [Trichuris trichiura]